jgi:hypothetical protein
LCCWGKGEGNVVSKRMKCCLGYVALSPSTIETHCPSLNNTSNAPWLGHVLLIVVLPWFGSNNCVLDIRVSSFPCENWISFFFKKIFLLINLCEMFYNFWNVAQ